MLLEMIGGEVIESCRGDPERVASRGVRLAKAKRKHLNYGEVVEILESIALADQHFLERLQVVPEVEPGLALRWVLPPVRTSDNNVDRIEFLALLVDTLEYLTDLADLNALDTNDGELVV